MLFTVDRLSGYRSIVHKTYFVLEYVVSYRFLHRDAPLICALPYRHGTHAWVCKALESGRPDS